MGIISQINFSIVLVIASQYLSATNIGVLHTARSLSDLVYSRLASATSGILYPLISNMSGGDKEKKALIITIFTRVFIVFTTLYLVLFFNWDRIVMLIYGADFLKVSELMNYLGIGSVIYFSTGVLVEYLKGSGLEIFAIVPHLFSILMQIIIISFFINEVNLISLSFLYVFSLVTSSLLLLYIVIQFKGTVSND